MAWIDHPPQLYTMFKPDRPIIDIPPAHQDPLRTPEDVPLRAPWISAHIDDAYHLTPFQVEHNRFPDVEDVGWAMGMVSPPSPSRRNSLELLPDVNTTTSPHYSDEIEGSEWEIGMISPHSPSRRNSLELPPDVDSDNVTDMDDPPILSPPSPSMRSSGGLPDTESDWPPPDFDCPQLSPPSPIYRSNVLPSLEFEAHSLFIEDVQPPPFVAQPEPLVNTPLRAEYRSLLSLRDRTMYTERTSRARNKALRGRERELGRAVATLRGSAAPNSDPAPPDATTTLHGYRAAATRVMLERTEEKRRRKRDKERLKELRVLLGTGVDALLSTEGDLSLSSDATTGLGMGLDPAPEHGGLGLALHAPPSAEDHARALAERTHMMRRLAACMTMRRRDLGMHSLVEAGNMADGADGVPKRALCRRSRLAHTAILGDPGGESGVLSS